MSASEMGCGNKEETEKEDMEEEEAPDIKETQVKGEDPILSLPANNHDGNVIANVHLQTGGDDAKSLYNSQTLDDANIGTNVGRVDGDNKKVGKLASVDNNAAAGQDFGESSPPKTNNNASVGENSNETSASKTDGSRLNQLECVAADERSSEIKAEIDEKGEKLNDASVVVESASELSVSKNDGSHAHPANQPECVVAEEKSSDIKAGINGKREKSGNGLVVDVSSNKHSGSKNDGTHEHPVNQPETAVVDERSSEIKAQIDDKGEKPNGISFVDVSANGLPGSKHDRSHVPPSNQVEIAAAHDRSTEIKAADDENGEKLNDEVADMELFPETEFKESKPEMDVGRDVSMKSSNLSFLFEPPVAEGDESGTEEEQAAFVKEVENFYKERNLEFKHPKFYKEDLNLLKLWRAVIKLGGYEEVTSCKLWRQVGESFNPPKTCTTVSWTFRIFYEKALLEYEKYRINNGEHTFHDDSLTEPSRIETQAAGCQALGSGRARRDAAARAMQGWHSKRLLGSGEVCQPIIKDKNSSCTPKSDRQIKNIGFLKRKKPSSVERTIPVANLKAANPQSDTMVIDIGPPADWVKINVKRTSDCFEVYALVPGLLREEVHVQSDPAGRLVISGQPEQLDNPWGVTPFKKVVSLPSRIDPHQTSAVVTLHGQLFVRVPYEQSDM